VFCVDWTVDDYSSFSHISVVTHLRDKVLNFFIMVQQPLVGQGLFSIENSWSHPFRHTTLGRIPPDKWSARSTDLYLTTHSTCKRQTSLPPAGFGPTIPTSERPQTHAYDRAATGISQNLELIEWNLEVTTCTSRLNTNSLQFIHVWKYSAWFARRTAIQFPRQYSPTGLSKGSMLCVSYELNLYI
jgi:hypothetical protein